jgi:hypothetical protein
MQGILDIPNRTNILTHNSNLITVERHNRRQTRHITLPHQPALRMLCQLARNAMHHPPIVKDDKIPFLPPVRVHSRRRVRAPLQLPADAPDLCKIRDRGHFARGGITRVQGLHTATCDLQGRLAGFEVAPDHLGGVVQHTVMTQCQAIEMTYWEGVDFLSFKGWEVALRFLVANACYAQTVVCGFAVFDPFVCSWCVLHRSVQSKPLFFFAEELEVSRSGED